MSDTCMACLYENEVGHASGCQHAAELTRLRSALAAAEERAAVAEKHLAIVVGALERVRDTCPLAVDSDRARDALAKVRE